MDEEKETGCGDYVSAADFTALLAVAKGQHDKLGIALTEIAVLRGEDCERDTDGPCGVCIKCCRRQGGVATKSPRVSPRAK